jgi:P4 family phage/plasmid primase-like protien
MVKESKKKKVKKITKKREAELYQWIGIIQRKPELYAGEINDIPYIPKHLLPELSEKFNFIKKYLEKNPPIKKFEIGIDGKCKPTKETVKYRIEQMINLDNIDKEEELENLSLISGIKITALRKQLENILKNKPKIKTKEISKPISKNIMLDRITQAKEYHKINPFFYDRNKIWFIWNKEKYRWEKSDEVDILANIYDDAGTDITTSKERTEITNALKHVGRRNIPKELSGFWVQFKGKLYNIEDEGILQASPRFFITNPIPHNMGENEDTPEIDKLFISWVGEDHKQELYEVLAFAQAPKYFIHRIICLIGSGANGKSTFLTLLRKYLDDDNVVSSSLEALMKVRFEGSKLYRKLVCLMGETNFGTMTQTDYIKGLSGEDKMRIEFKGKDSFDSVNNAKLILATNSLPMTADKTDGFYRRWKIINFNNKFIEEKNVLDKIPKEEYNNLTRKCFRILKEMWIERIFTNDGNFEYRKANYEKHSNPLVLFLDQNFEKDINSDYLTEDFREELLEFLAEHGFRELSPKAITQQLKINGFEIKQIKRGNIDRKRILGIKRKVSSHTSDTSGNPTHIIHGKQNEISDVSDVSDVKSKSLQETLG